MLWIFCGTGEQANAFGTQELLRTQQAVWCTPPTRCTWPAPFPEAGDELWLVWRQGPGTPVVVLGVGTILEPPRELYGTTVLWTDPDHPGIRDAALQLNYEDAGTAVSFLRLENIRLAAPGGVAPVNALNGLQSRFNTANPAQIDILRRTLPLP